MYNHWDEICTKKLGKGQKVVKGQLQYMNNLFVTKYINIHNCSPNTAKHEVNILLNPPNRTYHKLFS